MFPPSLQPTHSRDTPNFPPHVLGIEQGQVGFGPRHGMVTLTAGTRQRQPPAHFWGCPEEGLWQHLRGRGRRRVQSHKGALAWATPTAVASCPAPPAAPPPSLALPSPRLPAACMHAALISSNMDVPLPPQSPPHSSQKRWPPHPSHLPPAGQDSSSATHLPAPLQPLHSPPGKNRGGQGSPKAAKSN